MPVTGFLAHSKNSGVKLILAKLYEKFPTPIILDVTKLDTSISEEEASVYADTVSFLREESFIRSGNSVNHGKMTSNVVLTSKGLTVLNSTPEVLQVKAPLVLFSTLVWVNAALTAIAIIF